MADWNKIAGEVVGTCMTPGEIAERYEVDEDDVEQKLGEERVETCIGCGWWFWEFVGAVGDPLCEECRATSEGEPG